MEIDLKNKVVVIIGASSGIGRALSEAFYLEGANVVATYCTRCEFSEERVNSPRWYVFKCDVRDIENVSRLADEVKKKFGQINTVINCAGIVNDSLLTDMSEEMWSEVINVNLNGAYRVIQCFAREMMKQADGKIFTVSSVQATKARMSQGNYVASKAGLDALIRVAAKEYGQYGIRINAVSPGYIQTNMNKRNEMKRKHAEQESTVPIFENLASLVAFFIFASSDLFLCATGQNFIIDSRV